MRKKITVFLLSLFVVSGNFSHAQLNMEEDFPLAEKQWPYDIVQCVRAGNYENAAEQLIGFASNSAEPGLKESLLWDAERLRRIRLDYSLIREDTVTQIKERYKDVTQEEIKRWLDEGRFDWRIIDGRKRFLGPTVRNLFFQDDLFQKRLNRKYDSSFERARLRTALQVLDPDIPLDPYSNARRFQINMTIAVPADEIESGQTVRCWMPFPRELSYQQNVRVIDAFPEVLHIASNDAPHRSLYFERMVKTSEDIIFSATYEYIARPRYKQIDPSIVTNHVPAEVKPFIQEQPPHVRFTPELVKLAGSICGNETHPYFAARKLYDWICHNTHYRYAREYSTIPNISQYVFRHRYGDCGQLALLYITLCRIKGIPARWESGWMIYPEEKNLHDWTLIYLDPYGWIPVDPDFGMSALNDWQDLNKEERERLQDFYFGHLSPYRLIVNHDHGRPHSPSKKHWRSDTVDFQRGELETDKENLYFNRFEYSLKVVRNEPAAEPSN